MVEIFIPSICAQYNAELFGNGEIRSSLEFEIHDLDLMLSVI